MIKFHLLTRLHYAKDNPDCENANLQRYHPRLLSYPQQPGAINQPNCCCLGFYCLSNGLEPNQILGVQEPHRSSDCEDPTFKLTQDYDGYPTELSQVAIKINDRDRLTNRYHRTTTVLQATGAQVKNFTYFQRLRILRKLFSKHGIKMIVVAKSHEDFYSKSSINLPPELLEHTSCQP